MPLDTTTPLQPVTAIRAATRSGFALVEAEIHGPFAVHRSVTAAWNEERYTLTHIGSGGSLAQVPNLQVGRDLAVKLQAMYANWHFRELDAMASFPLAARRRLYDEIAKVAEPVGKRPARTRRKATD